MPDSLEAVRAALKRSDFSEARRLCAELVHSEPAAWTYLAAAEHGLGDSTAARAALGSAAAAAPEDPEPLIQLARLEIAEGRPREAVAQLRKAAGIPRSRAVQVNTIGEGLGNLGLIAEAEDCFRRALAADPGLQPARLNLALARLAAGDPAQAVDLLRDVLDARPDLAPAWLHLGGALNALGRYREAVDALEHRLGLAPGDPIALTWLGAAFQHLGAFDQAEARYRAALAADPCSADAHANLGKLLQAQGDRGRAAEHFRDALDGEPGHVQARSGLAAWLDNEGRYDEALALTGPGDDGVEWPELAPIRARILRHLGRPGEALRGLEQASSRRGLGADLSVQLGFSLAAVLDETGRYAEAWQTATEANRRRRSLMGRGIPEGDLAAMAEAVEALRTVFSESGMRRLPRSACASQRPVFVVGMPRSGKSLIEQILSSHREVAGAGEQTVVGDASARLGRRYGSWPGCADRAEPGFLDELAGSCLEALASVAGDDHARVVDTMPFNFVHLGLIEMLFPNARVIHCVRHPLDLLLRCYLKNFAGRTLSFAFSLDDLARYFTMYRSLMNHWQAVSGLRTHMLRYEDLVADPGAQARRAVAFLGLDWDPDCMRYHEPGVASSVAPTPVRRPLDDREVGAWRHYEKQLGEIAERLPITRYERGGF